MSQNQTFSFEFAISRLRPAGITVNLVGMKAIPLLLFAAAFTVAAAPAAKFDLRTLIVPGDGSMIHLRVNTQTGETWRLERTLKNRRWTSTDGTAMEKS